MPFLTVSGVTVACALNRQAQAAPQDIGDPGQPSFSGRWRRTVRGQIRTWSIVTAWLPRTDADALISALENPDPLTCSGDLIGGTVTCIGRLAGVRYRKFADGERAVVEFTLQDAEPWRPVLAYYRPGRPVAGLTHSRADGAPVATYYDRHGVLQTAAPGALRDDAWLYESHTGLYRRCTLLEGARTNVLWDSSNFAAGSAWTGEASFTLEPVASLISGQTAYKHTNDGLVSSRNRAQTRGVLTGQPETFYLVIENVDAASTGWGIFDATASAFVARGSFTWATETAQVIEGTGPVRTMKIADAGPNGGVVYLLAVTGTGTAGDDRSLFIYPSGTGTNTESAIIHHAQYEEAYVPSSPIVTPSAAGATRAGDSFVEAFAYAPQEMTLYFKFFELGTAILADGARIFNVGSAAGSAPRLYLDVTSAGRYRLFHHQDVGTRSSEMGTSTSFGQTVELRAVLYRDGSVQLHQSINGAAETSAPRTAALALPAAWSDTALWVNSVGTTRHGLMGLRSYGVSPGTLTLAQCRAAFPEHEGVAA